jgi:aspartyl-tRNA(Asn)/glutamyl-tRNA(Gln) amidotransferase subunit A
MVDCDPIGSISEIAELLAAGRVSAVDMTRHCLDRIARFDLDLHSFILNLTGFPTLSACTGFSNAGLPLSMQIIGKPSDEAAILAAADAFERATPWHRQHPKLVRGAR